MASPLTLAKARFDASLLAIQKDTEKELVKELRELGNEVRDEIRGSNKPPFRTGRLRKSVKTSVRRKSEVSLYSLLPQAPVWEYGGTIRPRGVPIKFETSHFVEGPVLEQSEDFDDRMGDVFDQVSHRHGWL